MSELITLYGGPADGRKLAWSGGDIIDLAPSEPVSIKTTSPATAPKITAFLRLTYRRSVRNRLVFVYQP